MKNSAWFDIRFKDKDRNQYRDSILATDFLQAKKRAKFLFRDLVGDGEIYLLDEKCFRVGDPVFFSTERRESDSDAA